MSSLILDTHIFIWLIDGDVTLPDKIRTLISENLSKGSVYISAISCWEIAMLEQKKRITLTEPCLSWIDNGLLRSGVQVLALTPQICVETCALPGDFHNDPVDRMIVASARLTESYLVTRDNAILAYSKKHYVNVVAA